LAALANSNVACESLCQLDCVLTDLLAAATTSSACRSLGFNQLTSLQGGDENAWAEPSAAAAGAALPGFGAPLLAMGFSSGIRPAAASTTEVGGFGASALSAAQAFPSAAFGGFGAAARPAFFAAPVTDAALFGAAAPASVGRAAAFGMPAVAPGAAGPGGFSFGSCSPSAVSGGPPSMFGGDFGAGFAAAPAFSMAPPAARVGPFGGPAAPANAFGEAAAPNPFSFGGHAPPKPIKGTASRAQFLGFGAQPASAPSAADAGASSVVVGGRSTAAAPYALTPFGAASWGALTSAAAAGQLGSPVSLSTAPTAAGFTFGAVSATTGSGARGVASTASAPPSTLIFDKLTALQSL
jgi:hypothetical protein